MQKLALKTWLAIFVGLLMVFGGLSLMLSLQGAQGFATWLGFAGNALASAWLLVGLYRWREVGWVKRLNAFVLATLGAGVVVSLFFAVQWEPGWRTAIYLYLALVGMLLGINLLRLILRPGHPIVGVARTTIEETLRQGVSVFFIVVLLVSLVILPLALGSEDRVTYMVQRFLTYATTWLYVLLALMTVLTAAYTVSREFSSKQVYMTLTKPVARWQYLLGKWLGIVLLNAVLVSVGGVAIYGFTMAIAQNPALNDLDRYEVDREVLTSRLALRAEPREISWSQMYRNVLEEKQARDPAKFGDVGDPIGALPDPFRQEVVADAVSRFYTIDGGSQRDYRFTGLSQAIASAEAAIARGEAMLVENVGLTADEAEQVVAFATGRPSELTQATYEKLTLQDIDTLRTILEREVIQLVLVPDMLPRPENRFVEVQLRINGQPWPPPPSPGATPPPTTLVLETENEIALPAALIPDNGTLVVTVAVPRERQDGLAQPYIQFNPKDAEIGLFYRVGSFETNLAMAMVLIWLKLCFLAMFGLVVGSLLSFPVAALAGLVVFVAASVSGVIHDSLSSFASVTDEGGAWTMIAGTIGSFFSKLGQGEITSALRMLVRLAGESFMLMVPSFGKFPVADPLSEGESIGLAQVRNATLTIGLLWTGMVGLLGLIFFSRREVAKVTV